MAAGAAQQKKPRQKKKNRWNPEIVEVSSRPAQPEMENDFIEWRLPGHAGAGKEKAEHVSERIRRGAQDRGFAVEERRGVVGGNQPDTQEQQRDHLLRDFVRFALADRHD